MAKDVFVNPYAFVPLPSEVVRRSASGHGGTSGQDAYSGVVEVEWRLETPLLLPATASPEKWIRDDGAISIPGSSIKGAVRSLHEALFNGCMRVVDEAFVPSYRDPAGKLEDADRWRLGIVLDQSDGYPTLIQMTSKPSEHWVDATELAAAWPKGRTPTNGDIVIVDGPIEPPKLDRKEIRQVRRVDVVRLRPDDAPVNDNSPFPIGQIFLPTDTAARRQFRRDRSKGRAFWAMSMLTDETASYDRGDEACVAGREEYAQACTGSNDRRLLEGARKDDGADPPWQRRAELKPVTWWTHLGTKDTVARRIAQSGFLFRGDVVWVRVDNGKVTGVRLAQLWRRAGRVAVGKRIGGSGPCLSGRHTQEDGLCLTCSTFGAADTGGERGGRGEQISYAGHVLFGSAASASGVALKTVDLAPLGTPNPGSGMFYVRMPGDPKPGEQNEIASHWGSSTDTPPSVVAGRKFYWHGNPDDQAAHWRQATGRPQLPRYQATEDQRRGKLSRPAQLVPVGTVFRTKIAVDQLNRLALESLLDALDPIRILTLYPGADRQIAVRLGGGKPFGLGAATPRILSIDVRSARERYAAPAADAGTWSSSDARSRAPQLHERVGRFAANLPYLARLLDRKGLGDSEPYLSYPPGDTWDRMGSKEFRESFEFFQETNGQQLAGGRHRPWRPLPRPLPDTNVELPITRRSGGAR